MSNQGILTFDELLDNGLETPKAKRGRPAKKTNEQDTPAKKPRRKKTDDEILAPDSDEKEKIELASNSVIAARRAAKERLDYYIKTNPNYKTLEQQIQVLRQKSIEYKQFGEMEHFQTCLASIKDIQEKQKLFKNITRTKTPEEITAMVNRIGSDQEIKAYRKEITAIEYEIKSLKVGSIIKKLGEIRSELKMRNYTGFESDDEVVIDLDSEEIDLDNDLEIENDKNIEVEYKKLLSHISDLTGIDVSQLRGMNTNAIKTALVTYRTDQDNRIEELETEKASIKAKMNARRREITGSNDITDLIHETYDNKADNYKKAKEILAAANVRWVENVAYKVCQKLNIMHEYAEAVSIGYSILAEAINNWEIAQRESDIAITFEDFARARLSYGIERGLLTVTGNGTISGSSRADLYHKKNKYYTRRRNELVAEYGDNVPMEVIDSIINSELGGKFDEGSIMKESDFISMVGGDDGDGSSDIWANASSDNEQSDASVITDAKQNVKVLVSCLQKLFTLFEKKIHSKTGQQYISNNRFFDKIDYELFLMHYGIKMKEREDGTEVRFSQEEMAQRIMEIWRSEGITKTISQSAVNTRIKNLNAKLQTALAQYPEIKTSLKYIFEFYTQHALIMEKVTDEYMNEEDENEEEIVE